jgi:hypothetical protein
VAEYLANAVQLIPANEPAIFTASIPCRAGYVYHEDETGIFILRGAVNCPTSCFARYRVTFNGNIAVPAGGTVAPIAVALSVNGEPRPTSRAIVTPAAAEDYFNVTCTALIDVPRGCCFTISLRNVAAEVDTPPETISLQNANLVIDRVA